MVHEISGLSHCSAGLATAPWLDGAPFLHQENGPGADAQVGPRVASPNPQGGPKEDPGTGWAARSWLVE